MTRGGRRVSAASSTVTTKPARPAARRPGGGRQPSSAWPPSHRTAHRPCRRGEGGRVERTGLGEDDHAPPESGAGHPDPEHPWPGPQVGDQFVHHRGGDLEVLGQAAVALVHQRRRPRPGRRRTGASANGVAPGRTRTRRGGPGGAAAGPAARPGRRVRPARAARPRRPPPRTRPPGWRRPTMRRSRRCPESTTTNSAGRGGRPRGSTRWRSRSAGRGRPVPRRTPAGPSGPTGTPIRCSAAWHSPAMTRASPSTPRTSASATASAALDDSPEPRGSVEPMWRDSPVSGRARPTTAATRRAQAGSSDGDAVGVGYERAGRPAPRVGVRDVTVIDRRHRATTFDRDAEADGHGQSQSLVVVGVVARSG